MKDENVREWGMIHPLDSLVVAPEDPTPSELAPTPANLIYQFTSSLALRKVKSALPSLATLPPALPNREPTEDEKHSASQALALHYGHPRFIEYPEIPEASIRNQVAARPILPFLFLALCIFAVWYIYHLTGKQVRMKSENNQYLETISQEKRSAAERVAPHVKVLTWQEKERSDVVAKLFWDVSKQTCQIYFDRLPEVPTATVFQLWYFTKTGQFIPVISFQATRGSAAVRFSLPNEIRMQLDWMVVSQEAPGYGEFPKGRILLRGRVQ